MFCKTLKEAGGPQEVWRLLEDADAQSIAMARSFKEITWWQKQINDGTN